MLDLKSIFLQEAFEIRDNVIYWTGKEGLDNIDTRLGKKGFEFRESKLRESGVTVLSIYAKRPSPTTTQIMKALKGQDSELSVDPHSLEVFVKRSAIFAARTISKMNVDYIITVRSSSDLVTLFQRKILSILPDKTVIPLPHLIDKDISNLRLDFQDIQVRPDVEKRLNQRLRKAKRENEFKIKKIPPQQRRFFRDWLKISDNELAKLDGSSVVILDDYITSGATLDEACLLLQTAGVKNITAIALIK